MKISLRIWVLGFFIAFSVISIINAEASKKLLVFLLFIGAILILKMVKSNKGAIFLSAVFIAASILLIVSSVQSGLLIESVAPESPEFAQGLRQGQILTAVNSNPVVTIEDYSSAISNIFTSQENKRIDFITNEGDFTVFTNQTPQITLGEVKKTNIKTGLDISGGARALVQPKQQITDEELADLIAVSNQRLNVFGLTDVTVRGVSDLLGDKFMLVEVAGVTPEDLRSLIGQQGKFEAKIGNLTAFIGGDKDITHVFRNDATQAVVFPAEQYSGGGYISRFSFGITLSQEAAQRHADITRNIAVDPASGSQYLAENLTLILDEKIVDELRISTGLKGQVTSQISIQGSGTGATPEEAVADARSSMNKLQTVLISGSLPFELEVVKLDSISPVLGDEFRKGLLTLGIVVFIAVSLLIFIRYRKIKLSLAVILTMFSEAIITVGIAALIGWNLDAPGIAGIIAGMGTGINDQIVLIDESVGNKQESLKQRIKRALFIILGAFLTIVAAMIPLFWAGAGLLKGFALTTIIGVSVGILITRPAFADIVKRLGEQ